MTDNEKVRDELVQLLEWLDCAMSNVNFNDKQSATMALIGAIDSAKEIQFLLGGSASSLDLKKMLDSY